MKGRVVTRVRRLATVAVMTPIATGAILVGAGTSAHAAAICNPLSSASISPPGSAKAGSTVQVSATVHNMLAGAHLQISGPGLSRSLGSKYMSGTISNSVTVQQAGYYSLSVVGTTGCVYDSSGFEVRARSTPKPKPHHTPKAHTPSYTNGNSGTPGTSNGDQLPFSGATSGTPGAGMPKNNSPFSLPSVAPDGTSGFQYPTPDPQIAAPQLKGQARSEVASTSPVNWGKSVAIALVLLLISAHLGMWSRRQRLAAMAARGTAPRSFRSNGQTTGVLAMFTALGRTLVTREPRPVAPPPVQLPATPPGHNVTRPDALSPIPPADEPPTAEPNSEPLASGQPSGEIVDPEPTVVTDAAKPLDTSEPVDSAKPTDTTESSDTAKPTPRLYRGRRRRDV